MKRGEFEQLKPQDKICSLYSGNVYTVKSLDLKTGDIHLPNNNIMRYQDCAKIRTDSPILGFRFNNGMYQAKILDNDSIQWRAIQSMGNQLYVMAGDTVTHTRMPVSFSSADTKEFMEFIQQSFLPRLFVDMDGTLAEFRTVKQLETLYEKGYFLDLSPIANVVEAIREVVEQKECEVYILSSVVDSGYAINEKNKWLDCYLPEISSEHRIFLPCGDNKADYVPYGIRENDILLDDYTTNLLAWPQKGIKLLNGMNHTHGRWQGECIDAALSPQDFADQLAEHFKALQPEEGYEIE